MTLGADLESAWQQPGATAVLRKRILRTAIVEIVVSLAGDAIELVIHWQGGDHTRCQSPRTESVSTAGGATPRSAISFKP